jgi:FkbM family methyltransferase
LTADPFNTVEIDVFGQRLILPGLREYRKFYAKLAAGNWEPRTFATLQRFLNKDTIYIDVGGWIGVTPFWASHLARRVLTVEPDPKCQAILRELAPRYSNVTVLEGALSPDPMVSINAVDGFGSSETSALPIGDGDTVTVPGISVPQLLDKAEGAPVFVKIDIEGYEYTIADELAKLANYPVKGVQLAVHPQLYAKSLQGSRLLRRCRAAWATYWLSRLFFGKLSGPHLTRFSGMPSYLIKGILLRSRPKGADFLYRSHGS